MERTTPTNAPPRRARPARRLAPLAVLALAVAGTPGGGDAPPRARSASVVLVTIDTLRADRLSVNGYSRPTSPNLDRLIRSGVNFRRARTVEPLTGPSLCSMLTSLQPQEHGATRNGLRMREGLPSLPRILRDAGYRTAAFLSNWTLKDKATGLAEHFDVYETVLNRKRWFGLVSSESTADDVNEAALDWLEDHERHHRDEAYLLWVHYVEPHAPYRLQREHLQRLGLPDRGSLPPADRYDTEVAEVDRAVGELLAAIERLGRGRDVLVAFASDHGESLGEHNYWGHGRHLYEPTLHVPMALSWPGRLRPGQVDAPALTVDLAPTIAGLLGLQPPERFGGYDWSPVLLGAQPPPEGRQTEHQAHRGAVLSHHDSDLARRSGLLEVAVIHGEIKEILRVRNGRHRRFDLARDPAELGDFSSAKTAPGEALQEWTRVVYAALNDLDDTPIEPLDDESSQSLRALGYAD